MVTRGSRTARRYGIWLLVSLAALAALLPGGAAPAAEPRAVTIQSLDLHDGMVVRQGRTYYLYGTEYGCGFNWQDGRTPWCGFGVSTARSLHGPWSEPRLLVSPDDTDPYTGASWAEECAGYGCFNPRMIQRSGWGSDDGAWLLWFNSPADYGRNQANAYNVLGCDSPAGPCGPQAGGHGWYHKPRLTRCYGNGDFGLAVDPVRHNAAMVCTMPDSTLSVEELSRSGRDGTGRGSDQLAGLTSVESPGIWYEPAADAWFGTYSDPRCGYCAGTATGYMTAKHMLGPWTVPANLAAAGLPERGRRTLSATSCGGQPRTVSLLNGLPWQGIDLWTGTPNETGAGLHFEPLEYIPTTGTAGDGGLWHPPFADFTCG